VFAKTLKPKDRNKYQKKRPNPVVGELPVSANNTRIPNAIHTANYKQAKSISRR